MQLPEIVRRRVEHILGDFCEARVPRLRAIRCDSNSAFVTTP